MKNFLRRTLITLKYRPSVIALVVFLAAFVVYSFNYFSVSTAINTYHGKHMGLCSFIVFLGSLLGMLTLINAFPKRKRANVPMLVIACVLIAAVIAADIGYIVSVMKVIKDENGIWHGEVGDIAKKAISIMTSDIVMMGVVAILLAFMPLYGKLLKKIKTNVEIDDNGELKKIDIEE